MNESKATRYQRLRRRAEAVASVAGAALLAALAFTSSSRKLAIWAGSVAPASPALLHAAVVLLAFVTVIVLLWEIVALPAVLYFGLIVDRRFRNTNHSVQSVLVAHAHAALVALPAAWIVAGAVIGGAHFVGRFWWAVAGLLLAGALVGAARIMPSVLARFGRVRPLAKSELTKRLADLAARASVPIASVDEWTVAETARVSALVAGIGRTRRVFVSSDTLRDWTDDEIGVVVAHELAHHAHHDLWRTLGLSAVILVSALWCADALLDLAAGRLGLAGPADLAALPLIALAAGVVWLALTPVRHAQSRRHERAADRFALTLTGADDAFGAAIRRLGSHHLAEERPSLVTRWLYHRHPSVEERLAAAVAFRDESRSPGFSTRARSL